MVMRTYYSLIMIALLGWFAWHQIYFCLVLAAIALMLGVVTRFFPRAISKLDLFHVLAAASLTVLVWDWRFFGNAILIIFWTSVLPVIVYDTFFKRA